MRPKAPTVPVRWQQECDSFVAACSQSCAILRQHSFSAEVSAAFGSKQAIVGDANKVTASMNTPSFAKSFNVKSVRPAES